MVAENRWLPCAAGLIAISPCSASAGDLIRDFSGRMTAVEFRGIPTAPGNRTFARDFSQTGRNVRTLRTSARYFRSRVCKLTVHALRTRVYKSVTTTEFLGLMVFETRRYEEKRWSLSRYHTHAVRV